MSAANIYEIITGLGGERAPLLQVLLIVQGNNPENYISEESVNEISRQLKVSRSRVYSTASFYSEISLKPRGRHIIRVCTNAPCENAGNAKIIRTLEQELGISRGETTADGLFTLDAVNCLGVCYMSPSIKIDDTVYGNMTPEKVKSIIEGIRKEHMDACTY